MEPDLYDRLGVPPTASAEEIRRAYRREAVRAHPDTGGADVVRMVALNDAWRVLREPASRARYDRSLGIESGGPPPRRLRLLFTVAFLAMVTLLLLIAVLGFSSGPTAP